MIYHRKTYVNISYNLLFESRCCVCRAFWSIIPGRGGSWVAWSIKWSSAREEKRKKKEFIRAIFGGAWPSRLERICRSLLFRREQRAARKRAFAPPYAGFYRVGVDFFPERSSGRTDFPKGFLYTYEVIFLIKTNLFPIDMFSFVRLFCCPEYSNGRN